MEINLNTPFRLRIEGQQQSVSHRVVDSKRANGKESIQESQLLYVDDVCEEKHGVSKLAR